MTSIDNHLYKCTECGGLVFEKKELCILTNDKSRLEVRQIQLVCNKCGHKGPKLNS